MKLLLIIITKKVLWKSCKKSKLGEYQRSIEMTFD